MTSPTPQQLAQSGTLEDLYKQLEPIRLGAGWAKPTPSLWAEPKKSFQPFVWSYAQAKGALDAAGRLINTELAERRNLIMQNPAGGSYATSRTIVAAYQMIMPGEKARSHRHTPNALRLIIDADPGAYTIVNGERLSMMPGDVVLTPNWCWHGHGNDSRANAYWLDVLDVPLVHLLEPMFFEPHPDEFEKETVVANASPMHFSWADTERRLTATEGDREFLLTELKRLQVEKAELERQFNDLSVLRTQVAKLKEELTVSRRLEWLRMGIYGMQDKKGAELLMAKGGPATKTNNFSHTASTTASR